MNLYKYMKSFLDNKLNIFLVILVLLPIGYFYWLRLTTATNIPNWDDYGGVLAFLNSFVDSPSIYLKLKLLISRYAEHRLLYVRLVTVIDYLIFGQVNFIHLNIIGNLGLLGIAYLFYQSMPKHPNRLLYFVTVSFLLFQLQYFTIIFGSMSALQNINTVLFAFASLYLLSKDQPKYFLFALVFAGLATFSSGNGMFAFLAGLIILFNRRKIDLYTAAWVIIMIGSILFYFYKYDTTGYNGIVSGYTQVDPLKVHRTVIRSPDKAMSFWFSFVGSSIRNISNKYGFLLAIISGFSATVFFLYLIYKKYFQKNPLLFSYLVFLFFSALSVTVVRFDGSAQYAFVPRYRFFSILILIVIYLISIDFFDLYKKKLYAIIIIALSIVFYFSVLNFSLKKLDHKRDLLIAGVKSYHRYNEQSGRIVEDITTAIKRTQTLESEKLRLATSHSTQIQARNIIYNAEKRKIFNMPPTKKMAFALQPLPPETDSLKYYVLVEKQTNKFIVIKNAWAFYEGSNAGENRTYLVLVSSDNRYVFPTTSVPRPEIVKLYGSEKYLKSGFKFKTLRARIKDGEYKLGLVIARDLEILGFKFTNKVIRIVSDEEATNQSTIKTEQTGNIKQKD